MRKPLPNGREGGRGRRKGKWRPVSLVDKPSRRRTTPDSNPPDHHQRQAVKRDEDDPPQRLIKPKSAHSSEP